MHRWFWVIFLFCVVGGTGWVKSVQAQSAPIVTFSSTETVNQFPTSLTFRTTVAIDQGEIAAAKLLLRNSNFINLASGTTVIDLEINPNQTVNLDYVWAITTVPSTPFYYSWEITDSAGNVVRSPEELIYYDDTRYDWQILENEYLAVWWHDRSESFGEQVYEIANEAFTAQQAIFQAELAFPIKIIIYNNFDEFAEWQGGLVDFIGGQAFPNIGVTTQIVEAFGSQEQWLSDVVPHEISHLYLAQVSYNPTAPVPVWLDEGVAQFNEFGDHSFTLREVERAAANGELIPLSSLRYGFGFQNSEEDTRLAYAEGLSATTYLVETYGTQGLADLLAAYKAGHGTEEAFLMALGVTAGEFEAGWAVWLGLDPGEYVTPTPWPLPSPRPSPTLMTFATRTPVPEVTVTEELAAATLPPTETSLATTFAQTNVTVVVQTPTPGNTPTRSDISQGNSPGACSGLGLILPLLVFALPRRKKQL